MANPWDNDRVVTPAGGATITSMDPYAGEDQAIKRERLRLSQQEAARAAAEADFRQRERLEKQEKEQAEKAKAEQARVIGMRDSLYQLRNTINAAKAAKEKSNDFFATGFGAETAAGVGGTSAADVAALLNTIKSNTAFDRLQKMREESPTGGALGAVSEIELRLLSDSIASLNQSQSDTQFRSNMDKVIDAYDRVAKKLQHADQYYTESGSMEGYTPPTEETLSAMPSIADNASAAPPPTAAGAGATEQGLPIPPAMQAEHQDYMQRNAGTLDPQDYARFRAELDAKYGFSTGDPASAVAYAEAVRDSGIDASGGQIPPATAPLEGVDQFRNSFVSSTPGAFLAGAANAGGFGVPSLLAGDQMTALREEAPTASLLGEIAGGVGGTLLGGAALRGVAGRVASPTAASALANPLTADVAYGATYGATQADDPLYGAVAGAGGAFLGNRIGGAVGRRLPGAFGVRSVSDPLSRGERAIMGTVGDTDEVAAALTRGGEMGVPVTLADTTPELASLAGSATRFSPTTAGQARAIMGMRNEGQLDRLVGAIERDLGPATNIPQRSEDLLQQARAQAAPLYEQAYAAPGFDRVAPEISSLLNRPSMRQAMSRASRIAQEEGRDPRTLGLLRDDAGDVVLNLDPTELRNAVELAEDRLNRELVKGTGSNLGGNARAISEARASLDAAKQRLSGAPAQGSTIEQAYPSWQTLDYVKRGIDDVLEQYRDKTTGRLVLDTEGRAINNTLQEFLGKVDAVNPDYAAARSAYAGPASERDFLRRGQGIINRSPDQLGVDFSKITPEQQAQMRLGAQSEMVNRAGNLRNNSNPWSQINTPNTEARLGTMYQGAEDADIARLLGQRDLELELAGNANRLIGNSATAERAIADEFFKKQPSSALGDVGAGIVETAALGGPWLTVGRGLANRFMRDRQEAAALQANRSLADELGPLLLEGTPQQSLDRLTDITARDAGYQDLLLQALQQAERRGGSVGAGAMTGAITNLSGF